MTSRGSGDSMGRALVNAIADAADGTVGARRSYTAQGWHAQISKLTSSPRGYLAAERAGLSVNHRTLVDWLAERRDPSAANQSKIARAYQIMAGRWPEEIERQGVEITGLVRIGGDERERGVPPHAPLRIDGSAGDWGRMRRAWNEADVSADSFEEWFIEDVLEADLGDSSEPWEFPGSAYTVVIG